MSDVALLSAQWRSQRMDTYEATTLPVAPDDTLLRLVTAAHLARYKGRSREHVLSDPAPTSGGARSVDNNHSA